MHSQNPAGQQSGRAQFLIAISLLGFLAITTLALALLAHNDALFKWVADSRQEIDRNRKSRYSHEHYFVDFEDRLINEELPAADYSRGGVYLMGTSNLKWATRLWELPEDRRALIHNYGIGATSHLFQFHFLRYLVEQRGLLAAGGHKNLVIFGLSYHSVGPDYDPKEFFPRLWARHGFFRYDADRGIEELEANPVRRMIRIERVRITGFVKSTLSIAAYRIGYGSKVRIHNPKEYVRHRSAGAGEKWQIRMDAQIAHFEDMVDYLRSRDAKVAVVFLPHGSWEAQMPFARAYNDAVHRICHRRAIPTLDWSAVLNDDDFADSNHLAPSGVDKMQPRFVEIAESFLHTTGILQ